MGFVEELASRLGAVRRGAMLVVPDEIAITILVRNDIRIHTAVPALDGAWLTARVGDSGMPPDAEAGEAPFDRAWRITTDAPELAPLVLAQPVRSALDATRTMERGPIETAVQLTLRAGELELLRQDGDRSVERALAAVEVVRAVARRPGEIRDEVTAAVSAVAGRVTSTPWSWATGFTATVPCGRIASVLEQRLEAGRPVVRLAAEGVADAAWGEIRRRDLAEGYAWRTSGLDGMVVAGDPSPFADAAAIAEIAPSAIVVGTPERAPRHGPTVVQRLPSGQALVVDPATGRYAVIDDAPMPAPSTGGATRCEIRWNGWLPAPAAIQRAVRWLAATLDQAVHDSPYR